MKILTKLRFKNSSIKARAVTIGSASALKGAAPRDRSTRFLPNATELREPEKRRLNFVCCFQGKNPNRGRSRQ